MGAPHTSDPPVFDLHVERTMPAPPKHHGHASGAHDGAAAGRHFDVGISTHQTPMRLAARETDPVATPAPTIDWDAAELAGLGVSALRDIVGAAHGRPPLDAVGTANAFAATPPAPEEDA